MSNLLPIDFHTHLNNEAPGRDPGVWKVVSLDLAHRDLVLPENCLATLELHPWQGDIFSEEFARSAAAEKFIGIGEAGLDRIRGKLPLPEQIAIFRRTVELACKLNKPLTVHCVKCFSELLELKKHLEWQVPTIIHYFRNNLKLAQQLWTQTDFYLSLPPGVPAEVLDFLRSNPEYLSRIVLETDDPDGDIAAHYTFTAQKLAISPEKLTGFMHEQFQRIYHVNRQ